MDCAYTGDYTILYYTSACSPACNGSGGLYERRYYTYSTRARPPACDGRVHLLTRDNTIPLMRSHLRVVDGAAPAVLADVAAVGSVAVVLLEALGQGQG